MPVQKPGPQFAGMAGYPVLFNEAYQFVSAGRVDEIRVVRVAGDEEQEWKDKQTFHT